MDDTEFLKDGGGRKGTSGGECYGTLNTSTEIGSGAGYVNACIHSGSNDYTDGNTVWYNYVAASAGTIKNSSATDTTGNINTATESVCPKGWTLPSKKQMDNNRESINFYPILGGFYRNGVLYQSSILGSWWGNGSNSRDRDVLAYLNGNLFTDTGGFRYSGTYIRCVSEEKDVSDLTYMQDMTPSVAANTAERTTFPTILQELCVIVNVLRA